MEILKEFNLPQTVLLLIGGIVLYLKLQALDQSQRERHESLEHRLDERHENTEKRLDKIENDLTSARQNIHTLYQKVIEELAKAIGIIVRHDHAA